MREFLGYATRLALFCSMLPILLSASTERADALPPVKLAVFEFELEDFSGGASILPANPSDFEQLKHVTNEARQLIAQSGRYTVVDVSSADAEAVRAHSLRNCDGCDAGIALKFGAQQSLVGFVTRISRTGIHGSVSDSRRPDRCRRLQSADRSSHGRHRILEPRSGLVDQESVVAEPGLATRRGLGSQTFGFTLCLHPQGSLWYKTVGATSTVSVASKHGVSGLTKSAALQFATQGIRVNAVAPGLVHTPLTDRMAAGRRASVARPNISCVNELPLMADISLPLSRGRPCSTLSPSGG
jgi:NAD(P)-dependent dehydrogenase (short-subunit alcohol dehydrogenase family)